MPAARANDTLTYALLNQPGDETGAGDEITSTGVKRTGPDRTAPRSCPQIGCGWDDGSVRARLIPILNAATDK
jgi:hypothetical protein